MNWKSNAKRLLCVVLVAVMLLGVLPASAFAAEASTVVDAAIIFSDLHTNKSDYKESTIKGIMGALKNTGLPFSSVTSAGDAFSVNEDNSWSNGPYTGLTSTITGYIRTALENSTIPVNYVWSDHDRYAVQEDDTTLLSNDSGMIYGAGADGTYGTDDDANYYIFSLSMADLSTNNRYSADFHTDAEVTAAIEEFTSDVSSLKKDRPLFIASHQPLFDRRDDNGHAAEWFEAINAAALTMDIAFFFGHNHKYDQASDYYYAKGSTMPVCQSDYSAKNETLNFTHMCAGYMEPTSTGSYSSSGTRRGVAVAITIYEDSINYTTYDANGVYTGSFALNETVDRAFAAPAAPTVETVTFLDGIVSISATALGLTDIDATNVSDAGDIANVDLSNTFTDYIAYDVELVGYTEGDEVDYSMFLLDDMATANLAVYHIAEDGTMTPVSFETVTDEQGNRYLEFSASTDGIFAYGEITVPEGYTLERIEVVNQGDTKYFIGDSLDATRLSVVAVYTKEGADDFRRTIYIKDDYVTFDGYTISGFDMNKTGKQYVTVSYGGCVGTFAIEVFQKTFTNDAGDVTVEFTNYGITSMQAAAQPKTVEGYSAYVTYSITPVGYTQGDVATVTIAVDTTLFDTSLPVKVLDQGTVIATTNIEDGKVTFTTNHFSEYDVVQADTADATVDSSKWIEVVPATGGTTTYNYTWDTNGKDNDTAYLFVNGTSTTVMENNGTSGVTTATVNSNDGTNVVAPSQNYEWKIDSSNRIYTTINNSTYYLRRANGANSLSLTTNSNQATTWDIANNNGEYTISRTVSFIGTTTYYVTASGLSTTRGTVRLYSYKDSTTTDGSPATYGQVVGNTSYQVTLGTTEAAALQKVKDGMTVYYTTDNTSTTGHFFEDDGDGMSWIIDDYDPNTAGEYTVTIKYNNVTLGTATVEVVARTAKEVTLDKYEGTVERDSGASVETGAYLTVTWEDNTTERVPVTVGMLSGNSSLNVNKNGTYSGLSFSYAGQTFENFTLKVVNKTGVNDYPTYPNPGSVDVKKSATGIDFQNTGIARVELSTSGLPAGKGVDVVIVLDTSSSMRYNAAGTAVGYDNATSRYSIMKASLLNMLNQFKQANPTTGVVPDVDLAIIDFNGFGSHGNDESYHDACASLNKSPWSDSSNCRNATDYATMYTGVNAGEYVKNITLSANDFVKNTSTDMNPQAIVNMFTGGHSGTNYDTALINAYKLLEAKKAANTEPRAQYVIFMSDGASFMYNGYSTGNSTGRDRFDPWLSGIWEDVDAVKNAYTDNDDTYAYFYNGNGTNHPHRVAEAIKGNANQTYPVVVKHSSAADNTPAYMENWQGLGATIYSIGFCITGDDGEGSDRTGAVTADTAKEVINVISSGEGFAYPDVTDEDQLTSAFSQIVNSISFAATNARFVDQMGSSFNLQMDPTIKTNAQGSNGTTTTNTDITITTHPVYTSSQVGTTVNGYRVSQDDVGKPYGNGTTVETVSFEIVDGKIVATSSVGGYKLPGGTTVVANSTNILVDGVICAKNFFYNGNTTARIVTLADGSAYELPAETFYWNIGTVNEKRYTIAYTVYLDGSMDGNAPPSDSYATNNFAILYYTNHEGNEVSKSVASPSIAWKGAQVSYAFYLVDEDGNPLYANGTQAPNFLLAHKVTQPVVYKNVLLNTTGGTNLSAAALDVLPQGYALYARDASYTVNIYSGDGQGEIPSGWSITGDEDETTYVMGYKGANDYDNTQSVTDTSYDYTHTTVYFAVVWTIGTVPDTVVIDFGLPVDISVMANDMFGTDGTLTGVGKAESKPDSYTTTMADGFGTSVDGEFGEAVVSGDKVRYTLDKSNSMQMNDAELLAYAVDYAGSENPGYYYGDLTVIPATTVYYEDEYVTLTTYNRPDAQTAYNSTPGWPVNSAAATDTQGEDRPGSFNLGTIDANNIYGFDAAYEQMSTFSMGSSAMIHVDANQYGTAEFEFYGTGFDVISATSNKTGMLVVQVYDENGSLATNSAGEKLSKAVDTYYGYTYGLYNVVYEKVDGLWTKVSVGDPAPEGTAAKTKEEITSGAPKEDGTVTGYQYTWKPVENDPNALYQVPVIRFTDLAYGKYTVKISALYYSTFDSTAPAGYDLYLDAIRVYNPAGTTSEELGTTIENAYSADGELYPSYQELRNLILDAAVVKNLTQNETVEGIAFIDGNTALADGNALNENAVADYTNYGPNNELYLAAGQAVAFQFTAATKQDYIPVVRIGMKTVGGKDAVAELWNVSGSGTKYNTVSETLKTATDMYYDITVLNGGTVVIKNSGEEGSILSITNIKTTYRPNEASAAGLSENGVAPASEDAPMMFSVSRSAVNAALLSLAPQADETTEPETEPTEPETEPTEPTEPETEPTEPETEPTEPETEPTEPETEPTEPETEPTEPEQSAPSIGNTIKNALNRLLGIITGWFRR